MVDSLSGVSNTSNVLKASKNNQPQRNQDSGKVSEERVNDQLSLSIEAISLSQAEEASKNVASSLSENQNLSLGLDEGFEDIIV